MYVHVSNTIRTFTGVIIIRIISLNLTVYLIVLGVTVGIMRTDFF